MDERAQRKRIATGLGAGLMIGGTAIYLGYRFTLRDGFIFAGLVWTGAGVFLGLLAIFFALTSPPPRKFAVLVVWANLPLALLYAVSMVDVVSRLEVRVRNESGVPISGVVVVGGGAEVTIGDLAPGESRRGIHRARGDGSLVTVFTACGRIRHARADTYVSNNLGGWLELTVHADFSVTPNSDHPLLIWPLLP